MAELVGIKLTWEDPNDFEDGFNVYRSTSAFDKNSLPALYKTLPANTKTYVDTEVLENTTYYYMLSTFVGNKEVFSPNLENVRVDPAPGPIGTETEGGVVIGHITLDASYGADEGVYAIVMAGLAGQSSAMSWSTSSVDVTGAQSTKDGLANTYACVAANSVTPAVGHPAAEYCVGYNGGGFSDWYMPSKDELNLAYANRNELVGLLSLPNEYHWSSSQDSASKAWIHDLSNGAQFSGSKSISSRVRPVRRLKIQ